MWDTQKEKQKNKIHGEAEIQHKDIASHQVFSSVSICPKEQNVGRESFGHLQTDTPYMHLNYCVPSQKISISSELSGVKSENNPYPSDMKNNQKDMSLAVQAQIGDPVLVTKEVQQFGCGQINQSNTEEEILGELGSSSNVQESSSMHTKFDENSSEASSFYQLQQVMEQVWRSLLVL